MIRPIELYQMELELVPCSESIEDTYLWISIRFDYS